MLKSTDVFLALGRRGSGKSYLAERISQAYPRRVIFDPLHEHSGSGGGDICSTFDQFSKKILDTEGSKEFKIIYQFDIEKEDNVPEFNQALRVLWHRGNVMIHVEEIQELCGTHGMPSWLKKQLLTGRHRNNGLIFTTQRPGECHKTIVSQANHVFCGPLHEKNDIEYVRTILHDGAFKLMDLPDRHFFYFRPSQKLILINNDLKTLKEIDSAHSTY